MLTAGYRAGQNTVPVVKYCGGNRQVSIECVFYDLFTI